MSGFARGVADAMLEGRIASAESSARLAEAEAESLQHKVWQLERELSELERILWKTVGEREGFKSLMIGFSQAAEKMVQPEQKNELYKTSILSARDYLNNKVKEKFRPHVAYAWAQIDFGWGESYPLVEFKPHGEKPTPPKPPAEMEVITKKILGFICYRMYFVRHQGFHSRRGAQKFINSLQREYNSQIEKYNLENNQWLIIKNSYENQQEKIKEYDLNQSH